MCVLAANFFFLFLHWSGSVHKHLVEKNMTRFFNKKYWTEKLMHEMIGLNEKWESEREKKAYPQNDTACSTIALISPNKCIFCILTESKHGYAHAHSA